MELDEQTIKKWIDEKYRNGFGKRIGDTPTEDYQLANKRYVDNAISSYFAVVDAAGNKTTGSSVITTSRTATGKFTITHNFGHTNYGASATVSDVSIGATVLIISRTTTNFQVWIYNSTLSLDDVAFNVLINS